MNNELKREWRESRLPKEACDAARERAWRRVSRPSSAAWRAWAPVAAGALATAVLAVVLWPMVADWFGSAPPQSARTIAPTVGNLPPLAGKAPAERPLREVGPVETRIAARQVTNRTGKARRAARPEAPEASPPRQQKLVVNFTLPKTGVRMIWILDEDFGKNTEARNDY